MSEELKETTSSAEQIEENQQKKSDEKSNIKAQIEEKLDTKIDEQNSNQKLRNNLKTDLTNVQALLNSGLINQQQGQNLLNHILRTAIDSTTQPLEENPKTPFDKEFALKEFEKESPDFFKAEGRSEIMKYLQADEIQFDKDELSKIAKIVEQVEKSAIERYLKKVAHEESLEKFNNEAKSKLQANAQNSKSDGKNLQPFTREQIGKMSSAEFLKYESLIMEQLKKGLIK